jgi:thiamine-monophosphate kinase
LDEFSLIKQFFSAPPDTSSTGNGVLVGIGDDAAVIHSEAGKDLLITTDTLISGTHFPEQTSAVAVGHKALAVNLSDIAAMGGQPRWFTLALSLPSADADWLGKFSDGLLSLARQHAVTLVGGDTTRGPLSITISVIGTVSAGEAVKRSGAQPGDAIFVTGSPGMAALALAELEGKIKLTDTEKSDFRRKLEFPRPRLLESQFLRPLVSSMIDISDGLAADLGHILAASDCAAIIEQDSFSDCLRSSTIPRGSIVNAALYGGDDYELLFTVPEKHLSTLERGWQKEFTTLTRIGEVMEGGGIKMTDTSGIDMNITPHGYNHFNDQR